MKPSICFARIVALFLSITITLPNSVRHMALEDSPTGCGESFALRPREPENGTPVYAGLEESLGWAKSPPVPTWVSGYNRIIQPDRIQKAASWGELFGETSPLSITLEVGPGDGNVLFDSAKGAEKEEPTRRFIGIEHPDANGNELTWRVGQLGGRDFDKYPTNVRFFLGDIRDFLVRTKDLPPVQKIFIGFPEPPPLSYFGDGITLEGLIRRVAPGGEFIVRSSQPIILDAFKKAIEQVGDPRWLTVQEETALDLPTTEYSDRLKGKGPIKIARYAPESAGLEETVTITPDAFILGLDRIRPDRILRGPDGQSYLTWMIGRDREGHITSIAVHQSDEKPIIISRQELRKMTYDDAGTQRPRPILDLELGGFFSEVRNGNQWILNSLDEMGIARVQKWKNRRSIGDPIPLSRELLNGLRYTSSSATAGLEETRLIQWQGGEGDSERAEYYRRKYDLKKISAAELGVPVEKDVFIFDAGHIQVDGSRALLITDLQTGLRFSHPAMTLKSYSLFDGLTGLLDNEMPFHLEMTGVLAPQVILSPALPSTSGLEEAVLSKELDSAL